MITDQTCTASRPSTLVCNKTVNYVFRDISLPFEGSTRNEFVYICD